MRRPMAVGELYSLSYWVTWGMSFENTPKPSSALPECTFGNVVRQPLKRIVLPPAARIFRMRVMCDFMAPPPVERDRLQRVLFW